MDWNKLAYADIQTTPLTTINGNETNYLGLEIKNDRSEEEEWLPLDKPVTDNYLLVQNSEVLSIATQLVNENNLTIDMHKQKQMFNGRQFKLFLPLEDHLQKEIQPGDTVRTGLVFQNSYDMSMSFGFSIYLERLLCSNGMTGISQFPFVKFRHTHKSADWMDEIFRTSSALQATGAFNQVIDKLAEMTQIRVDYDWCVNNYKELMTDIPSNLADPIIRNFFQKGDDSMWALMNAGTDIMWHKESGNQFASIKHNGTFVNNLIGLV